MQHKVDSDDTKVIKILTAYIDFIHIEHTTISVNTMDC